MLKTILSSGIMLNMVLVSFGADLLKSDFEDKTLFSPEVRGYCGKGNEISGRWGFFTDKGPMIITDNIHSGSQAVKLIRGGSRLTARSNISIAAEADVKFSTWIKRNGKAGFTILLYGSKRRNKKLASFYIQQGGKVYTGSLKDGKFKWHYLEMKFPENVWCKLTVLTVGGKDRLFSVEISDENGKRLSFANDIMPIHKGIIDSFDFRNAGGNAVFIDDICLESKSLNRKSKVTGEK
jgi:hypothetical protein